MPETAIQADANTTLCEFPRRNRQTGRDELLRVAASDYGGRIFLQCRVWYGARAAHPDDDGWRPDKARGITIRESELDELAEAIEEARRLVHEQGRSTAPDASPRRSRRA